ncbi:hypothetical protein V2G26_020576 [Clonostachys chloroleuca]
MALGPFSSAQAGGRDRKTELPPPLECCWTLVCGRLRSVARHLIPRPPDPGQIWRSSGMAIPIDCDKLGVTVPVYQSFYQSSPFFQRKRAGRRVDSALGIPNTIHGLTETNA